MSFLLFMCLYGTSANSLYSGMLKALYILNILT